MIHGANLEYQDIALRNTLFWAVYNNNRYIDNNNMIMKKINNIRELAMFLIQCGARVRPWSWLQTSNLPEPLRRDAKLQVRDFYSVCLQCFVCLQDLIRSASSRPPSLALMAVTRVRAGLVRGAGGRSLLASIERLPCESAVKRILRFDGACGKRENKEADTDKIKQQTVKNSQVQ